MKSKMWNKIFKNKSSSKSSRKTTITPNETNNDIDDHNLYDDLQEEQQVMIPSCSSSSSDNHPHNNDHNTIKSTSKLSKMVNSFTLKRNSNKENGNNNNSNCGYNNDVALSIIRNAELNNDITKFNNNNYNKNNSNNNLNKNIKRHKSIDDNDDVGGGNGDIDDFIPIMDTTSKLIKNKTPPDEIPLSPKSDFNDPNFSISHEPTEQIELQTCPICTRKFVPATLIKHVGICERMATKKRKKFDSFRQRREGTDLAAYLPKNFGIPTTHVNQTTRQQTIIEPKILSPKIQIQESTPVAAHKQFETESQNTQKKSTLNPISPTSKPVRSKNVVKRLAPTSEQCPHCERSFGIKAFDRHVDWCKEKSRLNASKNNADLKTAKNRLEARTKYRAPNLKAKRDTIRNKYSGNGDDGHSIDDNRSVDNNIFSMSNSLSSSFMSDGPCDEKPKVSSCALGIKAQKIITESISNDEATINLKVIKKPQQKSKLTKSTTKNIKKQNSKIIKKEIVIKDLDNDEEPSIQNEELNLIGLSFNFGNDSENHDIANDDHLVSFDNDENISNKMTPISTNIEGISHDGLDKLATVGDRVEIEEIIPLNCINFDDTPIKPAKKSMIDKQFANIYDETPIRPTKTILHNNPCLVLPPISEGIKVEELKNDLQLDSAKSIIQEKSQNKSVENLKSTRRKQPNSRNVRNEKNIPRSPSAKTIICKADSILPTICTTKSEDVKVDLQISSKLSNVKQERLSEIEVKPEVPAIPNKIIPDPKKHFTPIQSPKIIIKDKPVTPINDMVIQKPEANLRKSYTNNINEIVVENTPNEIINDQFSNEFNEMPIRSTKRIDRDVQKNDVKETLIHQRIKPITNKADEISTQIFEPMLNTTKDNITQINIQSYCNDVISSNRPIMSKRIRPDTEKFTPIQSPKIILKDNPDNFLNVVEIQKMKPILRSPHTKSVHDITNKLSKDVLRDKYANNFNEIPTETFKTLNSKSLPLLNISDHIKEASEIRPTRKQSLKTILPPINRPSLASISSDDFDKLLSSSEQINGRKESQTSFKNSKNIKKDDDKVHLPKVFSRNSVRNTSSNESTENNFWTNISNDTMSEKKLDQAKLTNFNGENVHKQSGFSDKYDPFLSAKRQLEELCSPTTEAESPFLTKQQHQPISTSTPITIKPKLTTSLSTSYTAPSPNPRNTLNTVKTNFRRTSSLRSPRKNNPCPRPLFMPSSRCSRPTTIQRGISDEGPISTNFIRPEEYDEMPVKSACINNFATAINSPQFARRDSSPQKLLSRSTSRESSPLVIKRDPNSNLNRRNLRLNLGNNKELNSNSSNNIPLLKTDSLAVFLKYEKELTKNPSDKLIASLNKLNNSPPIVLPQQNSISTALPVSNLISEKDWKDKSNNLSKQNSLKNSSSDLVEKTFGNVEKEKLTLLKNSLTNLLDSNNGNNNKVTETPKKLPYPEKAPPDVNNPVTPINKPLSFKLEPLHQNVYKNITTPPPSKTQSPPIVMPSLAPLFPQIKSTPMTVAINNNLINLNSILNIDSKEIDNNNFIDPKLINICDNLQVITTNTTTTKQSDDSDLTSIGSQDSAYRPKTAPNLFTDERRHSSGNQSSESVIEKSPSPSPPLTQQRTEQYQNQTSINRNSTDKKNLLKRQIRLGKNQFLYDASPSDSEPSPDPIINNSQDDLINSVTSTTTITHLPLVESSEKQFDSLLSPSNNPIFNNFDFEEFLSSFEASNDDDEQFPGFKDCKEFLMNRCLNMRSMNNNFINNNNNNNFINNTQNSIRSRQIELDPMMMLNDSNSNNNKKKRQPSHDDDDDVQIVHDKREIFISIETDQNDNETLNPCPNDPSIKNPKIEEINGNDNKFTKIETYHLPIFEERDENLTTDFISDITIQRNNVKNKQQHEDIKDNITCDSVASMYPVDSDERSSIECYPIGRRSVKSKTSADSAYGSLSRQSPTLTDRSSVQRNSANRNNYQRLPNEQYIPSTESNILQSNDSLKRRNRELSASSSGSENSLPPINSHNHHQHHHNQQQKTLLSSYQEETNLQNSKDSINNTMDFGSLPSPGGQQQQMSKFCHECGSRFLVSQAKFCMECGVKRIVLK